MSRNFIERIDFMISLSLEVAMKMGKPMFPDCFVGFLCVIEELVLNLTSKISKS